MTIFVFRATCLTPAHFRFTSKVISQSSTPLSPVCNCSGGPVALQGAHHRNSNNGSVAVVGVSTNCPSWPVYACAARFEIETDRGVRISTTPDIVGVIAVLRAAITYANNQNPARVSRIRQGKIAIHQQRYLFLLCFV